MKGDIVVTYLVELDAEERKELIKEIKALKLKNKPYPQNWYLKNLLNLLEDLE